MFGKSLIPWRLGVALRFCNRARTGCAPGPQRVRLGRTPSEATATQPVQALDYCRKKAAPPGSSLHYALLFATPVQRDGLLALHAFHREVTAIPGEVSDPAVGRAKLDWWRGEIDRVFERQPEHPVGHALVPVIRQSGLPRERFEDIITGTALDLEYGVYPSFRELSAYGHQVGCAMADLALRQAGYNDPASARFGHHLGMALLLTGRLRHLGRHARAGRFYLPEDEIHAAGLSREGLLRLPADHPGLQHLLQQQVDRARDFFRQADTALADRDRYAQRPALIMAALYRQLLVELERQGLPMLHRRVHLTPLRKLWLAWRTARRERRHQTQ